MSRGSECQSRQQNGWDTSSQEYHERILRLARTPSIHPNVPQYPNVHTVFNKVTREEESESHHNHQQRNHNHGFPQFQEKVEVIEYKVERVPYGDEQAEVVEEVIDVEGDSIILQKYRGYQPLKWNNSKAF